MPGVRLVLRARRRGGNLLHGRRQRCGLRHADHFDLVVDVLREVHVALGVSRYVGTSVAGVGVDGSGVSR